MEAWVLRLKDESKTEGMTGEYYFSDNVEIEGVTHDLQKATTYQDKNKEIEIMKKHERFITERYGEDSVINYGYTNMMKHFEFIEVKIEESV